MAAAGQGPHAQYDEAFVLWHDRASLMLEVDRWGGQWPWCVCCAKVAQSNHYEANHKRKFNHWQQDYISKSHV